MILEKIRLADKIILLTFQNQLELTSTLLRFQEHYESPEFRGKVFSLDEYKQWYTQNSPLGQKTGKFTYYSDWNGFNFPSYVLTPFREGRFNPLTDKEQEILNTLNQEQNPFYTIGIHRENKKEVIANCLNHEIAHGLFYTDEEYQRKVLAEIRSEDLSELRKRLSASGGYHSSVLEDELHAYSLSSVKNVAPIVPENLKIRLTQIFKEHAKLNHLSIPTEFKLK